MNVYIPTDNLRAFLRAQGLELPADQLSISCDTSCVAEEVSALVRRAQAQAAAQDTRAAVLAFHTDVAAPDSHRRAIVEWRGGFEYVNVAPERMDALRAVPGVRVRDVGSVAEERRRDAEFAARREAAWASPTANFGDDIGFISKDSAAD